jgi:hypothetical protein
MKINNLSDSLKIDMMANNPIVKNKYSLDPDMAMG